MGFDLQPNVHQLARNGAWYAAIKRVDVSAFGKTLYLWRVGNDHAGGRTPAPRRRSDRSLAQSL
jgi:hypothetical protein